MNANASTIQRHSRHLSPLGQEAMTVDESIASDDWSSEVGVKEYGLAGLDSEYTSESFRPFNFVIRN